MVVQNTVDSLTTKSSLPIAAFNVWDGFDAFSAEAKEKAEVEAAATEEAGEEATEEATEEAKPEEAAEE